MSELDDLATDISKVYGGPWWRFWQRKRTKEEVLIALRQALAGNHEAIELYGVAMPKSAQSIGTRWQAIKRQLGRVSGRFPNV